MVVLPFALIAPEGLVDSVERQLGRPLQIESLGASLLLAAISSGSTTRRSSPRTARRTSPGRCRTRSPTAQTVLQAAALVAVWILFARGPATPARLVAACAASVVVFVAFGKVLSPQFLIWLVPRRRRSSPDGRPRRRRLLGAALVTTHLWFPTRYWDLVDLEPVGWLALVRNVLLVALAGRPRRR